MKQLNHWQDKIFLRAMRGEELTVEFFSELRAHYTITPEELITFVDAMAQTIANLGATDAEIVTDAESTDSSAVLPIPE